MFLSFRTTLMYQSNKDMDGLKMKYKEMNLNIFQINNIITLEGGGMEKNLSNLKHSILTTCSKPLVKE